jgi:tetratricopeptide (TPR) repeat protein
MLVLSIVLALAASECDASLQPVTLALQQSDFAKASSLLSAVPADCSQSSAFYSLTGVTEELSGKTEQAESAFRKAISLDPKSPRLREQLGATYLRNKKPAEAAEQLEQAVGMDPQNVTVKKYLIGAYVETDAWEKSAKLFDQIGGKSSAGGDPILLMWFARTLIETRQTSRLDTDLPPPSAGLAPALLFSLGTLLAQHGIYSKAVDYLRSIPDNEADDAVSFNLGLAYSHLQNYDEARKAYFLAIDKHPKHVEAYFRVGLDFAASGNSRKALPWLFRAHQWAPARPDIAYALVEQLIRLSYFDTCSDVLRVASQSNSTDALLLVADADLKLAKGDLDAAITGYRQVLVKEHRLGPALVGLARAEIAKGNEQEGRSNLLAALSENPDDPSANGELGLLEAGQGNWASAAPHLNTAWAHDRSNPVIILKLAEARSHLGHPAEALQLLTSTQSFFEESPAYHLELTRVYTQLNKPHEANAEREKFSHLQADSQQGLHFESPRVYVP